MAVSWWQAEPILEVSRSRLKSGISPCTGPSRLRSSSTGSGHTATLLRNGQVLLSGGRTVAGESAGPLSPLSPLSIDASTMTALEVPSPAAPLADEAVPFVVGSTPGNDARDVALDTRIVVHFSSALRMDSLTTGTIRLTGRSGELRTNVVGAEGGRLAFVWPLDDLEDGARYTLTVEGATTDRGVAIVPATIAFTTAKRAAAADVAEPEAWRPDAGNGGWRSGRPPSPWESLPALQAPPGTTAISGRVLRLDGRPLPNVTLEIEGHEAETDKTGRFLLIADGADGLQTGEHTLDIDGRTANQPNRTYGFYEARIGVRAGTTNVLPFTIWSPVLDTAHQVTIPSPTTGETVITTPLIPGLELHLPAGTVIRDEDHQVVRTISITPIPLDRTPFPLPDEATFTMYFTIQPGGAYLYTPGRAGGWLVYPRIGHSPVGKRVRFFNYDPEDKGWYAYGMGTVRETTVVPDARTRLYAFTGASFNDGNEPPAAGPPPGDCCGNDGYPVNLTTGIFWDEMTDLVVQDVMPLALTRTYNSQDTDPSSPRPFGIGMTHPYAMFLHSENAFEEADIILPDGGKVHYVRSTESGPSWWQTIFEHTTSPTAFYKSRITFWGGIISNGGWELKQKDGTVYVFGHAAPLQAIRDRNGNEIRLTWSDVNTFGSGAGNLVRITSPHGRWIELSYYAGTTRVQQAKDNIGRTVSYTYDASGRLWKVTDPMNHVTEYTYDTNHRMTTIKNRNGVEYVTNEYTTAADAPTPVGWVKKQTHADGGVYEFTYTVTNGKSTQTEVTDPRGYVRRVLFNPAGYTVGDTRALSQPEEQTATSARPASDNLIGTSTDNLLRQTAHSYDPFGNETSIVRLAGTNDEATTTDTFDPIFSQITSTTDPLNRTTSFEFDARGNATAEVDPLNHRTTQTYNAKGQLLTVTDALEHTTHFAYVGGNLTSVQDPLGRITTRLVDAAGRVVATTNPAGQTTTYEYDILGRRTKTIDPSGGQTTMTYYPEGQLQSVTDAQDHTTSYTYDSMGRPVSRTDGLGRTETLVYDLAGNVIEFVDRSGQTTIRTYDPLDRLHQVTHADASTTTYTYDGEGRLVTIEDSVSGSITRTYDVFDRLTSETTPEGAVSYTYDGVGRRATLTVAGQLPLEYGYDDAGRLTMLTQGTAVFTLQYDDANRRTSLTLPNGTVTEYAYDAASQLIGLTYKLGQTTLGDLTYTYDLSGNRVTVGGTFARTALPPGTSIAAYDAANQLIQWSGQNFSFDANGSLRSDGLTDYLWNARQQLVGISGTVPSTFRYDADGRRVERTIDGTTAVHLHANDDVIQEQSSGVTAARVAGYDADEWWSRTDAAGSLMPLVDAQGSSIALADGLGAILTQYTYEPFGRTSVTGAGTSNRFAYTGREVEQNARAGLYYYRARYYDANAGRFISQDPLGISAGINVYEYVGGNPTNATDPTGLYRLKGFPPARHAQMRQAIRELYTRLKQNPCCIDPGLRDRVLELIHPGENGTGVTFQYKAVIPVPGRRRGVVVCGLVGGLGDFFSNTAQISRAAMDGTCDCPLPGTILHEVVHLTYSNFFAPWSAEDKAYAAAEACFGPACSRVIR